VRAEGCFPAVILFIKFFNSDSEMQRSFGCRHSRGVLVVIWPDMLGKAVGMLTE
jgi:hypothetical protein